MQRTPCLQSHLCEAILCGPGLQLLPFRSSSTTAFLRSMSHRPTVTCACYDHPLLHEGVHLTAAREHAPAAGLCDGGQSGSHGVSLDLREPLRTHVTLEPSAHLLTHGVPTAVWVSGCPQACGPPTAPPLATHQQTVSVTDGFPSAPCPQHSCCRGFL